MGIVDKIQLWASRRAWKQLTGAPDLPSEMRTVIHGCLIPLCIDPLKWMDNTVWLETQGMPQLRGAKDLRPTPSIAKWTQRGNRPPGFPVWFLAAFPDVALWAAKEVKDLILAQDRVFKGGRVSEEDERTLAVQGDLKARYETVYPGDVMHTPDGKFSLCYLKNLAEFYYNCLGRRPECRL